METLNFDHPAGRHRPRRRVHVGVVASGNLEVLLAPAAGPRSTVRVRTSALGFASQWQAIVARFFERHDVAATIEINDAGASPPVVLLRLEQALEKALA